MKLRLKQLCYYCEAVVYNFVEDTDWYYLPEVDRYCHAECLEMET